MSASISSRVDFGVETPFEMPVPGLFADLEFGCGSVSLTDEFILTTPSIRIEILRSWINTLSSHRDKAMVDMFREFASSNADQSILKQVERFKSECLKKSIDCPSDLHVLLQRY